MSRNRNKRRWIVLAAAAVLLVALAFAAFDTRLAVRTYTIDAEDMDVDIRIALLTDLHSCYYGAGQMDLLEELIRQDPHIVLLGGDIFDDELPDDNTASLLRNISRTFRRCYYVSGNHEYWAGKEAFNEKMAILEQCGIPVLSGEARGLEIQGKYIAICGVADPEARLLDEDFSYEAQLDAMDDAFKYCDYTMLLAHRPEYFDTYAEYGFDLVFSGHAHGGQWRIPGILNGLCAPNQGFFPKYAGGKYEKDGTTMIVSRGLARESTRVPRIFNRPELVIVDLI